MTLQPGMPAGFVDGARVPAEQLRRMLHAATSGGAGVVSPTDLEVTAMGTPTGEVSISPGSLIIPTKFPDAFPGQSYLASLRSAKVVAVPANSTGAPVVRYVVVSIRDPQYAGQATPGNPLDDEYTDWDVLSSVPTWKPAVAIASITLPANTAAVTAGMITDLRKLVRPRRERIVDTVSPPSSQGFGTGGYTAWPSSAPTFLIPSWATKLVAMVSYGGVKYGGSGSLSAGATRGDLGGASGTTAVTDPEGVSIACETTGVTRFAHVHTSTWTIPTAMRGTVQPVTIKAWESTGTGAFSIDNWSTVTYDLDFSESI